MDYIYYIAAAIVAVAAVGAIFLVRLLKLRKLRKLGIDGEKMVAKVLKRYAGIRSYRVINDLYLPLYDKTTQIDHILIGFFGLLVIETKNYKGEVYGDPKKKEWTHIVGGEKHSFYNPLMQNQAHIDCIRHILGLEGIYNVNIESLVVFTNKKLDLYVPSKMPIIKLKRLKKYLRQPRFDKDNEYDVAMLEAVFNKYRVTDKKLISEHNKNVKKASK